MQQGEKMSLSYTPTTNSQQANTKRDTNNNSNSIVSNSEHVNVKGCTTLRLYDRPTASDSATGVGVSLHTTANKQPQPTNSRNNNNSDANQHCDNNDRQRPTTTTPTSTAAIASTAPSNSRRRYECLGTIFECGSLHRLFSLLEQSGAARKEPLSVFFHFYCIHYVMYQEWKF